MACNVCSPQDQSCISVAAVLAPCTCSDTPATREEGPPGAQGAVGDTVTFTVGTVTEGSADVIFTINNPTDYTVDFVIPQPPINTANTWTAVQTYAAQAVFELGLETTGGTSTFGGTAFTVTPNANFAGNVAISGDSTIAGILTVEQNATIAGTLTVGGAITLNNLLINGQINFGSGAAFDISDATSGAFTRGYMVIDDCLNPRLVPNRGSDFYQKEDAVDIASVAASTSGPIGGVIVTVPISTCSPQITPVVTVMARVAYNFDATNNGVITVKLWKDGVGTGTVIDTFVQGFNTFQQASGGCIFLEGQGTLPVGGTGFFIEVINAAGAEFIPSQITFWITNT